jgi:hypothetical protein
MIDWETHWQELIESPGWVRIVELLATDRKDYVGQLITLASVSTDPKVVAVARQIQVIDQLVRMPHTEMERANRERLSRPSESVASGTRSPRRNG